ncbi:MAG: hypothetical protein JO306_01375, partial [Gemmatimonadetes bacterium]|nr:hypothetical protein [Gemmatimonadota bacterium]
EAERAAGRRVRVMNLHRAKGLEAPVVVLACPAPAVAGPPPACAVERGEDGVARGWLLARDGSRRAGGVLASPAGWQARAAAEAAWSDAEEVRLLYVAATRARDELVIARCGRTAGTSAWRAFHPALDDPALAAEVPIRPASPPPCSTRDTDVANAVSITALSASLAERRRVMARRAFHVEPQPLTDEQRDGSPKRDGTSGCAGARRMAIRRALCAAANGASGDELRGVCRDALFAGGAQGGPCAVVDEILAFVAAVRASAMWALGETAERRVAGAAFAIRVPPDEAGALGITDTQRGTPSERAARCETLVEGVIDLAYCRQGRWTVVDCSTFATRDAPAAADVARCRRQLDLCAACWERITGEEVASRLVMSPGGEIEWRGDSKRVP